MKTYWRRTGVMEKEGHYRGEPPLPKYDASPELKKLVLMFMGAPPINFLIADSAPIGMRIIKIEIALIDVYVHYRKCPNLQVSNVF
jgi:hypothetical protein